MRKSTFFALKTHWRGLVPKVRDRCGQRRFTNLDLDSIYGKRKRNLHPFQGLVPYKILAEGKTKNPRWFEKVERSIKRPTTDPWGATQVTFCDIPFIYSAVNPQIPFLGKIFLVKPILPNSRFHFQPSLWDNQVVASCVNTNFWLDKITRK